jgi:hemerythrin
MELAWTERLSVGNAMLDTEHKQLVDMVNGIERAIRARDCLALLRAFKPFEDYVRAHFENEARVAQSVNFPFVQHALEHQYVLEELRQMSKELAANDGRWSESAAEHYSYFLSEWLIEHLLQEDMLMKSALQKLPYNFEPD